MELKSNAFEMLCCTCSYHVHKDISVAAVVEVLACEKKRSRGVQGMGSYTVAVRNDGTVVGHLA